MTPKPVRLQRRRVKGFKLESPNGLPIVCVTRPGKWGNPFRVGDFVQFPPLKPGENGVVYWITDKRYAAGDGWSEITSASEAVECYRTYLNRLPSKLKELHELRGKNLACYCKPGDSCHADVLLKLANAPIAGEGGRR